MFVARDFILANYIAAWKTKARATSSRQRGDTLKLLGHAGDFYFFASINNKFKYQVKMDELKILKIQDFDKDEFKKGVVQTDREREVSKQD
jgi:hypothetical protein